jgi:hypothetical protein
MSNNRMTSAAFTFGILSVITFPISYALEVYINGLLHVYFSSVDATAVLSVLTLSAYFGGAIMSLPAIVLGIKVRINTEKGERDRRRATIGIVLGILTLFFFFLLIFALVMTKIGEINS